LAENLAGRFWGFGRRYEAENAVAVTLDLKPEVEAELMAQARAAGLSLAQFLSRELEAIALAAPAQLQRFLTDRINGRRNSTSGSIAFLSIRF
jgi:hypothetical protein